VWSSDYERGGIPVSGYELEIAQILRAAVAARSAGDQLAKLDVGCGIGGGVGALRGSRSGELLHRLEDNWLRRRRDFSGSLIDHATKLTWAAGDYATNDAKAAEAFTPPRAGGPREYL
jgi:hypothetical protein